MTQSIRVYRANKACAVQIHQDSRVSYTGALAWTWPSWACQRPQLQAYFILFVEAYVIDLVGHIFNFMIYCGLLSLL